MQEDGFFFNHSKGFSRWPSKWGILMRMLPCQIAGLQIKLHIQQIFHYEPSEFITAAGIVLLSMQFIAP